MLIDEVECGLSYNEIVEKFNNELGDEAKILLRTLLMLRDERK